MPAKSKYALACERTTITEGVLAIYKHSTAHNTSQNDHYLATMQNIKFNIII